MNSVITPVKTDERTKLGIQSGDTVRVHQKVVERGKTRIQVFEGLVITVKHGTEAGGTFTVRATLSGVGVEKTFPLYTPLIEKIEIVKRSKVRRAKLYFIREKAAKAVRRQLRNARMMGISTEDFKEEEPAEVPAEEPATEEAVESAPAAEVTAEEATPTEAETASASEETAAPETSAEEEPAPAAKAEEEKKEEAA